MTTFNTGNPVGSSDPRDLYDNAENADFLINGDQPAYNDRKGVSRKSWTGVEQQVAQQATEFAADQASRETTFANFLNSSGFEYLGVYGAGITFTEYNQYVVSAGEAWFISQSTPLPYTTTGAGVPEAGALMSRGEALLRQELGSGIRRVDSLAGLQAISGRFSGDVAYMVGRTTAGDGGEGEFRWDGSDLSASVSADTQQGVYVAPTSAPTGAGGAWVRSGVQSIKVSWFGHTGGAGVDESPSIKAAIDLALYLGIKTVNLPPGLTEINETGVFSYASGLTGQQGLNFVGDGPTSTTIKLITGGVPKYFYNNGDATGIYQFGFFTGINFISDDRRYGSFMRQWSSGHEQGFTFRDCYFQELFDVLSLQGTANASENRFYNCKFKFIKSSVLLLNNQQAVNTQFFACDAENVFKDLIFIDAGGGGSVLWQGGSVILAADPVYGDEAGWLVNEQTGSALGTANQDFTLSVKTELKTINKGLINTDTTTSSIIDVAFIRSNLQTTLGGDRTAVHVRAQDRVTFSEGCILPSSFLYEISGSNESQSSNGLIDFRDCKIPSSLSSRITVNNFYGRARGRSNVLSDLIGSTANHASDFDINPFQGGRGDNFSLVKSASLFPPRIGWPWGLVTDNNRTIILPPNATIKKISVYRPPLGGSTSIYQLFVGNDDRSVVYGSSGSTDMRLDHSFVVDNINVKTGITESSRTVRLWADGGDAFIYNVGYVLVEYL